MTITTLTIVRPGSSEPIAKVPVGDRGPNEPVFETISTSSVAIAEGAVVAFEVEPFLDYVAGARVRALSVATGAWMDGVVVSYVGGVLSVDVQASSGSGTYADWLITAVGQFNDKLVPGSVLNVRVVE